MEFFPTFLGKFGTSLYSKARVPCGEDRAVGRVIQKRSWSWYVDVAPDALWSLMADTARFNEAAGLPRQEITETPLEDGRVDYRARAKIGPFKLAWRETPVNWVAPRWLEHRRDFDQGPLSLLIARLTFEAEGEGTRFGVTLEVAPRTLVGRLILKWGFFPANERMYHDQLRAAEKHLEGTSPQAFQYSAPYPDRTARERGTALATAIEDSGYGHGLAKRLLEVIFQAQETDLIHLRPLRFARQEGLEERLVIELFLQSARLGLLDLRWDLLCPRCRIPKADASSLDKLPLGAHCDSCNIDYQRDFSRNVELSFSPSPAIRLLEAGEYCLFGPGSTPHILVQLAVDTGEVREVEADFPAGHYRLRTLEAGPELEIEHEGGPFPTVIIGGPQIETEPGSSAGTVSIRNDGPHPRIAIIEEKVWARDALTADRVTSMQAFRDLFSDQVLRPGDEVELRHVVLLFTDLKDSTALYNAIGDAAAYHTVRRHFAFLADIVRKHEGAIVKTIGDAVMASFVDPTEALEAAIEIQSSVAEFNATETGGAIILKIGLHVGPAIAVTFNDRLDYFGATVNMAARLQGESEGGDIVCSTDLMADPGVAERLSNRELERGSTQLKGFDEPVPFVRLREVAFS